MKAVIVLNKNDVERICSEMVESKMLIGKNAEIKSVKSTPEGIEIETGDIDRNSHQF